MILKVRENHLYKNAGWHMVSGISSISYSSKMTGISSTEELANSWFKEEFVEGQTIDPEELDKKVGRRRYFPPSDKSGEWIRIMVEFSGMLLNQEWIVQAEIYLLNDVGVTIERLF